MANFDNLGCTNTRRYPERTAYIVGLKEILSKASKLDFVLQVMESKGTGTLT